MNIKWTKALEDKLIDTKGTEENILNFQKEYKPTLAISTLTRRYRLLCQPHNMKDLLSPVKQLKKLKTDNLIGEIHKRGFFVSKEPLSRDERFKVKIKRFANKESIFGVMGDTHIGSKYQQMTFVHSFYKECEKREITEVYHVGDVTEGDGRLYKGQMYEMFLFGADAQADYVIRHYPHSKKIKTFIIGGNHDYSYYKSIGLDIVKEIADKRNDFRYLGTQGAYTEIDNLLIHLLHPDGGTAYAISYRLQKLIENYSPEQKPHIVFAGHYHRACWLPSYRNVEGLLIPCFQSQTPFLKGKNINPVIGGMIIHMRYDKTGLLTFKPEIIEYKVPIKNDY